MSSFRFLAFALVGAFIGSGAAQSEGFVEGHVFNLRTGVPVANAQVALTPSVPLFPENTPPGCVNCAARLLLAFTDASGFYSIHFSDEEIDVLIPAEVEILAVCHTKSGPVTTGPTHRLDMRDGTMKRDLYLPLPRRPRVRTCLGYTFAAPGS